MGDDILDKNINASDNLLNEESNEDLTELEKTTFSEQDFEGVKAFYNKVDPDCTSRQAITLSFATKYESEMDATINTSKIKFLFDLFGKGSLNYPSEDKITRAYVEKRLPEPSIGFTRQDNRLHLKLATTVPYGHNGIGAYLDLIDFITEQIAQPIAKVDSKIIKQTIQDVQDSISQIKSNHDWMASYKFWTKFLPEENPLTLEKKLELVSQYSYSDLEETFNDFTLRSFPTILYSGNLNQDDISHPLSYATQMFAGNGDESVIQPAKHRTLKVNEKRHHEFGPSEQTFFYRVIPLKRSPNSLREQFALSNFTSLLGGGFDSPLMQIIREKYHLVYGVNSSYYHENDVVIIHTNHAPDSFEAIEFLTEDITSAYLETGFDTSLIDAKKDQLVERMLVGRNAGRMVTSDMPSFRINKAYSHHVLKLNPLNLPQRYNLLFDMDQEESNEIARNLFDLENSLVYTYGRDEP
jgi:predicted Zn-dependent peptidase